MSDDDMGDTDGEQHGGVDFAGEGAILFPVEILRPDGDVRSLGRMDGGIQKASLICLWATSAGPEVCILLLYPRI